MNEQTTPQARRIRTKIIGILALIWATMVLSVLVWQLVAYRGLVAQLMEWQYARFDSSYPTATLALLMLLFLLPFLILLGLRIRKERASPSARRPLSVLQREMVLERFLLAIAGVFGVAAAVVAVIGFSVGGVSEKPQPVPLRAFYEGPVTEGMTRLQGNVLFNRIGFFESRLIYSERVLWVAPLTTDSTGTAIRVFAEIPRRDAGEAEVRQLTGFLRRQALPGALRRLYANAGYTIEQPTYVLFRDLASARKPYFGAAKDLLIVALLFSVFYLLQRRHRRKVGNTIDDKSD